MEIQDNMKKILERLKRLETSIQSQCPVVSTFSFGYVFRNLSLLYSLNTTTKKSIDCHATQSGLSVCKYFFSPLGKMKLKLTGLAGKDGMSTA